MKIFLISDLHLGHAKIIEYCNRPFSSVEEMDNEIIKRWNSVVGSDDIVYNLGDFCFGDKKNVAHYASLLNGRKMLICGNHDRYAPSDYMSCGFEWATRFPVIYSQFFILSHEPVYLEKNSVFANCYGHIHQNTYIGPNKNYFNCCVEHIDYTPILWEKVVASIEHQSPSGLGQIRPV